MEAFITSKVGHLKSIYVFYYKFSTELISQSEQFEKFKKWIVISQNDNLYELNQDGFKTFRPLADKMTWQYRLEMSVSINPPYFNTQKLSKYISYQLRQAFSLKYKRFFNTNTFITNSIDFGFFSLKKCIEFKVELFTNGSLLVNFLPTTKIISNQPITFNYLKGLRATAFTKSDDLYINLVEFKKFKRLKVNLNDLEDLKNVESFLKNNSESAVTFDYKFLAAYSPELFGKVVTETDKNIDNSIYYLQEKLNSIKFKDDYNFQIKLFQKVKTINVGLKNNLIVGNNQYVNKQSSAYHYGMYKPANNKKIQPITIDNYSELELFTDLILRFNKDAHDYEILKPINISSNDNGLEYTALNTLSKRNTLFALFTFHEHPTDLFKPLIKHGIQFQIYMGLPDKFKLSNFIVKCLEKQGGILSIISNTGVTDNTYFIGIDLGHSHEKKFSHLALVYFDKNGKLMHTFVNKNLPLNEAITSEGLWPCLFSFSKFLKQNNLPRAERIIIHRDGKMHAEDLDIFIKSIKKHLYVENIEIVEIIKNGFPVFAGFDTGAYINLDSGSSYIDYENKYALLITNTQADSKNSIINPLIIKHKFGSFPMEKIIEQVYWFTKIYTNNLFQSTKLPATTTKANNIASTTTKFYQSTYIG